jgi:hypothetical protein
VSTYRDVQISGATSVVVMDDFLYAELQQFVPEPSTLALLGIAVAWLIGLPRRRKTAGVGS